MNVNFKRGFLPSKDPCQSFSIYPELNILNVWGHDLPSLLLDPDFRDYSRSLTFPEWPEAILSSGSLYELRLYYLRIGFWVSGFINQVGQEACHTLPKNLAIPFVKACHLLNRPSVLSYDGYALYNWKRFDSSKPIALGNIDTLQNFVHLYDEHWFILVHVDIESKAAVILNAVMRIIENEGVDYDAEFDRIGKALREQVSVLKRIPDFMSSTLYFKHFRPYIRFFEHVVYEGVNIPPVDYRGETGAQSSIMPLLVALLKIPHRPSLLVDHLFDMRNYMPIKHRTLLERVECLPDFKPLINRDIFDSVLDAIADFRSVHYQWAIEYIANKTTDPRGTGGTPYLIWLKQLIDETHKYKAIE